MCYSDSFFKGLGFVEVMKKTIAAEGEMDAEIERQVCVTCQEQCVAACLKFGSSYALSPSILSLLLSHLHRNVQLDLIREAKGKIKLGVGPNDSIWGQAWSCDPIDLGGRQQRQPVSFLKGSLFIFE